MRAATLELTVAVCLAVALITTGAAMAFVAAVAEEEDDDDPKPIHQKPANRGPSAANTTRSQHRRKND